MRVQKLDWKEFLEPSTRVFIERLDEEQAYNRFRGPDRVRHVLGALSVERFWVTARTLDFITGQGRGMVGEYLDELEENRELEQQVLDGKMYSAHRDGSNQVAAQRLRDIDAAQVKYLKEYHSVFPEEIDLSQLYEYPEGSQVCVAMSRPDMTAPRSHPGLQARLQEWLLRPSPVPTLNVS